MKILVAVCDICFHDDPDSQTIAVAKRSVALDDRPPRELEVCEPHNSRLQALLGGVETRPSVVRQSKEYHCPVCLETIRRSGATLHLWRHTSKGRPPLQPKKCPSCKKGIDDARGMSRHRQNTHGWDGLAEAVAAAEKERLPIRFIGPNGHTRVTLASKSAAKKRATKSQPRKVAKVAKVAAAAISNPAE